VKIYVAAVEVVRKKKDEVKTGTKTGVGYC
jgi:hypothetical protein